MPCLNEGGQIERAYEAISASLRDVGDLELLIVDDGSADDTLEKVKRLAGAAPPALLSAVTLAVLAVAVASTALVGRYLHRLMLDQRRTRPYYIREANIPLRPEDTLDGGLHTPPPPVRGKVRASW